MAEVRCPMCGKPNAAEAEVCRFCSARLKPLVQAGSAGAAPSKPARPGEPLAARNISSPGEDLPEWLKELRETGGTRAEDSPSPSESQPLEGSGEDVPGWLARVRQRSQGEEGSASPENPFSEPSSSEESSDWLDQLRSSSSGVDNFPAASQPPEGNPLAQGADGLPSWLKDLGENRQQSAKADDIPEWLANLGMSNAGETPAPAAQSPEAAQSPASQPSDAASFDSSTPNWLSSLGEFPSSETIPEQPEKPAEAPPSQPVEQSAVEASLPDWLASLDETPSDPGTAPQAQMPGELTIQPETPTASPFEGALPGWLSALPETPAGDTAAQPEQPAGPVAEIHEATAAAPAEEAQPDWLASLQEPAASEPAAPQLEIQAEPPATIPEAPAAAPIEEPQPDWLASLRKTAALQPVVPAEPLAAIPEAPTATPAEEALPDWLTSLQAPAASEPAAPQPEAPAAAPVQEPLPDWLASLQAPAVSSDAQTPTTLESGLPDWLANLGGASTLEPLIPQAGDQVPSAVPAGAELPGAVVPEGTSGESKDLDWPFGQVQVPPGDAGLAQPPSMPPEQALVGKAAGWQAEITPDNEPGAAKPAEQPDWLAGLQPVEIPKAAPGEELPAVPTQNAVPEWLADLQGNQPVDWESTPAITEERAIINEKGAADQAKPFITEDLPDWLAQMELPGEMKPPAKPVEETVQNEVETTEKKEEEHGLEPAELPVWVQEMRPIETATPIATLPAEVDERQEKVGPLAGLRGILPAEAFPTAIRKPPVYTTRLQITDKQRINAAIFDSLLATEAEPQAVEKENPRLVRNVWSVVIALLLILLIWFPMWIGGLQLSLPGFSLPETNAVQRSVDALPAGATVLVACDYEPAMVGEMEAVSTGVIAHLLSKSVNVLLISTNPTGTVLGEQLLQRARAVSSQLAYPLAEKTVNLGYLAGGTSALFNFATYPQMAAPVTTDGRNAWEQPVLKNLDKGGNPLMNLAQIIVITADVDTARAWIEQVQPTITKVPLLVLTSAQSAPMISPYVDSGQVQGMVAGITGGSLYEQNTQRLSVGHSYWDSYQVGMLLLVVLIVVGGLVNAVDHLINSRKQRKGHDHAG